MNWSPLNLTVRVGCNLAYETTVPTPVLFVLKPRLEGRVIVMQERLSFGIGLPSYEFQDSHGNITCRSTFMPGRNEIRHDALVAVTSLPDRREIVGNLVPVGQLPHELLRYTLPSRYCDSDKLMNFAWNQFGQISPASRACRPSATGFTTTSNTAICPVAPTCPRPRSSHGATASAAISRPRPSRCAVHLISRRALSRDICRTSASLIPARRWIFTPIAKSIWGKSG